MLHSSPGHRFGQISLPCLLTCDLGQWFNLYYKSSNIIVSDINLHAFSNNSKIPPKNTDGWDTLSSSNIIIQDSVINNTDDCVSFKPNSSSIVIQNLNCNGSHGISVGSLGQYVGEVDIVEDVYVYNTSMSNASDGARLKVWPGRPAGSTATDAGGGTGRVRNVTYDLFHVQNDDYAIEINQCYGQNNLIACRQSPSKLVLEDVLFKDFTGTASAKYDPQVGRLVCSSPDVSRPCYLLFAIPGIVADVLVSFFFLFTRFASTSVGRI
jgi:galacturan 1,4-alpha-galacturonidase